MKNGTILAGGWCWTPGDSVTTMLSVWDGIGWRSLVSDSPGKIPKDVLALAEFHGEIVAGGHFSRIGGKEISWIARLTDHGWAPLGDSIRGPVFALLVHDGRLIVGGNLGPPPERLGIGAMEWDGEHWHRMGAIRGVVNCLAVYNNNLVASWSTESPDGASLDSILQWNGSEWVRIPGETGITGSVLTLLPDGDSLFAGGPFRPEVLGTWCIAGWDGQKWNSLSGGTNYTVRALAKYHGDLVIGGNFTLVGGASHPYIARWNGLSWSGFAGELDGPVYALAAEGEQLIVGGDFETAGSVQVQHVARWVDP